MNARTHKNPNWLTICVLLVIAIGAAYAQPSFPPCPVGGYPTVSCPIITDEVIQTNISSRLLGSVTAGNTPVCVQVNNGVVTLSGQVSDPMRKELATFLASSVRGVLKVNNLLVSGGPTAMDIALVGIVKNQISRQTFDTSQVRVYANSGVIELRGMVNSELARNVISAVASDVIGVTAVHNNLLVSNDAGNNLS